MHVTMTLYSRNTTRSRQVLDAASVKNVGKYMTKMLADGTVQYLQETVTWNQTALGQLARLLGEYAIELMRARMQIWEAPKDRDKSQIHIVTGTLSQGLYLSDISSSGSPKATSQMNLVSKKSATITTAASVSIDLDSSQTRSERSSLWPSGEAEGKAAVDYGYGFSNYRDYILRGVVSEDEDTSIQTIWNTLLNRNSIGPGVLNWPAGVKLSSAAGFDFLMAELTSRIDELRRENDEKIEESAQQRAAHANLESAGANYIPF